MFNFSEVDVDKPAITKDYLLEKIGEENIFSYYFSMAGGGTLEVGKKKFRNPLRPDDESPGCFFRWKNNLLFYDYASTERYYNVFSFIQKMYNCSFREALEIIYKDFNLNKIKKQYSTQKPVTKQKEYTKIQFTPIDFTDQALEWWGEYLITEEELKSENIYQVGKFWVNGDLFKTDFSFAYYYPEIDRVKIYSPGNDKMKWVANVPFDYIDTLSELPLECKDLLIVKSKKDKIVMKKIYGEVCAVQGENPHSISLSSEEFIKDNYQRAIIFFDNDDPGVRASIELNAKGFDYVNLDRWLYDCHNVKDPSDYVKQWKEIGYLDDLLKKKKMVCKI